MQRCRQFCTFIFFPIIKTSTEDTKKGKKQILTESIEHLEAFSGVSAKQTLLYASFDSPADQVEAKQKHNQVVLSLIQDRSAKRYIG